MTALTVREQAECLAYTALCALRDLHALAAQATTVDDVLLIHSCCTDLYDAADGAASVALDKADDLLMKGL